MSNIDAPYPIRYPLHCNTRVIQLPSKNNPIFSVKVQLSREALCWSSTFTAMYSKWSPRSLMHRSKSAWQGRNHMSLLLSESFWCHIAPDHFKLYNAVTRIKIFPCQGPNSCHVIAYTFSPVNACTYADVKQMTIIGITVESKGSVSGHRSLGSDGHFPFYYFDKISHNSDR